MSIENREKLPMEFIHKLAEGRDPAFKDNVKNLSYNYEELITSMAQHVIALQAKCDALAAENERAVAAVTVFSKLTEEITEIICDEIGHDRVAEILSAFNSLGNLPNTDAAIAEIKAQGVDAFAESVAEIHSKTQTGSSLEVQLAFTGDAAVSFAANLRAGRKG